jgi:GNAT superfamily N-acetyltransferase
VPAPLESALCVFGQAFADLRSIFYPCKFVQDGFLYAVTDTVPRRTDPRGTEYFVANRDPHEVVAKLREKPRTHYSLSVLHGSDWDLEPVRDRYRGLGFRLLRREPFMQLDLTGVTFADTASPARIARLTTLYEMERLNAKAGRRQLLPKHLGIDDSLLRVYIATDRSGDLLGWVRSSRIGEFAYVSNMYVREAYRRQGIGRALLNHMLSDDQRLGVKESVLLASMIGATVYPHLGYRQTGTLMIYSPPRS